MGNTHNYDVCLAAASRSDPKMRDIFDKKVGGRRERKSRERGERGEKGGKNQKSGGKYMGNTYNYDVCLAAASRSDPKIRDVFDKKVGGRGERERGERGERGERKGKIEKVWGNLYGKYTEL